METKVPFNIRGADVDDVPFIFNSWLKSFRDAPAVRSVPNAVYYAEHHALIEDVLNASGLVLVVACDKEVPTQIFGYGVAERRKNVFVVHFCYVKQPFRKFGIGTALLNTLSAANSESLDVHFSHLPKGMESLLKGLNYIYNPYTLTNRKESEE